MTLGTSVIWQLRFCPSVRNLIMPFKLLITSFLFYPFARSITDQSSRSSAVPPIIITDLTEDPIREQGSPQQPIQKDSDQPIRDDSTSSTSSGDQRKPEASALQVNIFE